MLDAREGGQAVTSWQLARLHIPRDWTLGGGNNTFPRRRAEVSQRRAEYTLILVVVDDAFDAVSEMRNVKVDQETDRFSTHPEMR